MTSLVNLAVPVLYVTAIDCLSSPYCQRLPGTQRNISLIYSFNVSGLLPRFLSVEGDGRDLACWKSN